MLAGCCASAPGPCSTPSSKPSSNAVGTGALRRQRQQLLPREALRRSDAILLQLVPDHRPQLGGADAGQRQPGWWAGATTCVLLVTPIHQTQSRELGRGSVAQRHRQIALD